MIIVIKENKEKLHFVNNNSVDLSFFPVIQILHILSLSPFFIFFLCFLMLFAICCTKGNYLCI